MCPHPEHQAPAGDPQFRCNDRGQGLLVFDWHSSAGGSFAVIEAMAAIFSHQAGKNTHCLPYWEQVIGMIAANTASSAAGPLGQTDEMPARTDCGQSLIV